VERGDRTGLAAYFARLIDRLASGGAELAAISAIAPHICIHELEKISRLPLVNVIQEVAAEIRLRGYHSECPAPFSSTAVIRNLLLNTSPSERSRPRGGRYAWAVTDE